MKRLSAILFLFILVFNFYGYRLLLSYMEKGGQVAMEQKLDQERYNDNELISIKTTLHLPYYSSSAEFERTYGSVTIDGVVYEYVKKRVYKDTLELLCLPNAEKTKLTAASNEITKASADGQASSPVKKGASTLKLSLPDFCQAFETTTYTVSVEKTDYLLLNENSLYPRHTDRQERPPQTVASVS